MNDHAWEFEALTDIWTGDAEGKPGRLIPTGLLGSIRWWFEVLVRGLGGSACDPTLDGVRCPEQEIKDPHAPGHHCVVCELFGCTGWARKFRFAVLDEQGHVKVDQIVKNQKFILRFTPLRRIADEEWALLDLTLRLIAEYGAIGGKTVFKPTDEPGLADLGLEDLRDNDSGVIVSRSRRGLPLRKGDLISYLGDSRVTSVEEIESLVQVKAHGESVLLTILRDGQELKIKAWYGKRHHQDYGLIKMCTPETITANERDLQDYVTDSRWRRVDHRDFAWASLNNFWCVKGRYLARQDADRSLYDKVLGREEQKGLGRQFRQDTTDVDKWLAGRQQQSKKVFSFKEPESARRTFGFVRPDIVDFNTIRERLKDSAWSDLEDGEVLAGQQILRTLLFIPNGGMS